MEATFGIGVLYQLTTFIKISTLSFIFFASHLKIIVINKVVARIVRRVDINHLDLASIVLAQDLERVEVVTLDIQVLGGIPVLALLRARTQHLVYATARLGAGFTLSRPCELVALAAALSNVTELLAQGIVVHSSMQFSVLPTNLRGHVGKECQKRLDVVTHHIFAQPFDPFHVLSLSFQFGKLTLKRTLLGKQGIAFCRLHLFGVFLRNARQLFG